MAIKFIDLCSGIGGFHSGLTATGHYECVGHAEIDPHASKAYAAIYGKEGGLNYGDLRKIKPQKLPDFDLLCAGFPCQSFSVAGRRLGFKDTRGTIFFEIARIIAEKRPSFILLENVPGLLYLFNQETEYIYIETPVGKWKIKTSKVPVKLEHINLATNPGCKTYHEQPRIFLSFIDTFDYIKRHDEKLLREKEEGKVYVKFISKD